MKAQSREYTRRQRAAVNRIWLAWRNGRLSWATAVKLADRIKGVTPKREANRS